jgi:hypothetical protein
MSEGVRGLVLLVSVLLWLPVLRPLLAGEMSTAEAGLRYAAALLLAWGGATLLTSIVRSYTSDTGTGDQAPGGDGPADGQARRRQEDTEQ